MHVCGSGTGPGTLRGRRVETASSMAMSEALYGCGCQLCAPSPQATVSQPMYIVGRARYTGVTGRRMRAEAGAEGRVGGIRVVQRAAAAAMGGGT